MTLRHDPATKTASLPATMIDPGLRSALNKHPVPTLLLDSQMAIIDANQALESLFNQGLPALVAKPLGKLISWFSTELLTSFIENPEKSLFAYAIDIGLAESKAIVADISIGPSQDHGLRVLAIHPVPVALRSGYRPSGAASRSASAAAAMLAHEIKNPLSGIRGAAQLLGKANGVGDPASLSSLIVGEVDRIAKLIDNMQGFTTDTPPICQPINIYQALSQAKAIAATGFGSHVNFSELFDPSLPLAHANHDATVQILLNLLKNACEAAQHGSRPMVRLATAYRHGLSWASSDGHERRALPIEISVMDNGPGVSDGLLDILFDPFVTTKTDGQGLGLALVEKLTREMGGFVEHDRADGWTRFRLHLPLVPSPSEPTPQSEAM
ncbi:MAG: ATP-binding protein [Sphingopyxis sp.]